MTMPSTNIGIAATNAPAKPLRREGIRCMKLSRGRRRNLGKETISVAGLSVAVALAGVSVQLALAGGRDSCRVYRWHSQEENPLVTAEYTEPANGSDRSSSRCPPHEIY